MRVTPALPAVLSRPQVEQVVQLLKLADWFDAHELRDRCDERLVQLLTGISNRQQVGAGCKLMPGLPAGQGARHGRCSAPTLQTPRLLCFVARPLHGSALPGSSADRHCVATAAASFPSDCNPATTHHLLQINDSREEAAAMALEAGVQHYLTKTGMLADASHCKQQG